MNKIQFRNILLASISSILFAACGGGGGGGGATTTQTTTTVNSTNYYQYAWQTNPNINATFKSNYSIDSGAHINISTAWTRTKGKYIQAGANNGQGVKVAVIDEDFDINHPDIKDKIIATYNVMDDTTNVSNTNKTSFSHGTSVAGAIASSEGTNDNLGVAPDVQLILINIDLAEFDGDTSTVTDAQLAAAFAKADELGAKVINCSWGGGTLGSDTTTEITRLKNKNTTIIFASGNGNPTTKIGYNLDDPDNDDPSELSTVIGVGATSAANDVTRYSNYGSTIDIIAPGGGRDLTSSVNITLPLLDETGTSGDNTSLGLLNNNYTFSSGTSFSAPITSGVVALMYAVNPNLTFDDVRRILTTTAEKVGTSNGADYSTGNFDTRRAYGKVHASNAVSQAESEY